MRSTATMWLGLAVAYYHDKKYLEAEHACAEALILDNHNGEVWGVLCLVALRQVCFDMHLCHDLEATVFNTAS